MMYKVSRRSGVRFAVLAAVMAASVNVSATQGATANGAVPQLTPQQVQAAIAAAEAQRREAAAPDPAVPAGIEAKWGVEVLSISYAADGFWLDFRFRVTDPEKAGVLFDSKIKPYVSIPGERYKLGVAEASRIGSMRTTNRGNGHNIKPGRIYSMMFSNPGFHVQPGQQVSVAAGDFQVQGLTVRGAHNYVHVNPISHQE